MTTLQGTPATVRGGEVLAGKYRVERVLGQGGMGVVVAAHHIQLDEKVALKFLLPEALNNPEAVARFVREARAAVKIKSEHIARVTDVGQLENGSPYMVMEYLEGADLSVWVKQRGPLPLEQVVDFVLQACEAIAEAHAIGIIHRDLKPANLFCVLRPDLRLTIKVLDFGISKVTMPGAPGHDMTHTAAIVGSPNYMSPEQLQSSKGVDARTDIWSLGVILFELLTGQVPFGAESLTELVIRIATVPAPPVRSLRHDVPEGLARVIATCLEKQRERRFASVSELAIALKDFGSKRAKESVERIVSTLRAAGVSAAELPPSGAYPAAGTSAAYGPAVSAPQTAATWGRTGPRTSVRPGASRAGLWLGISGFLVAGGIGTVLVVQRLPVRAGGASSATAATNAAVLAASSTATATATTASSVVPAASASASSTATPPTASTVAVTPTATGHHWPAAQPTATATTSPAVHPAADCNPPFTIDAKGHHVPKPECL